ncbi:hypothetical protein HBI23_012660 [Parastagonospora nodorum]|nr:hypothetical protein HBI79_005550 [Parastagonospora nodorum]KAH5337694.1 hypothetical protein HBI12_015330 [Parastagonospora nodorum]KAH5690629.1 hypothetical protein HBI23_012660 [Parastagonospora nodorum]KAH6437075.1 hypothetical protein HBI14_016380 [Parastagonospora nodorum]
MLRVTDKATCVCLPAAKRPLLEGRQLLCHGKHGGLKVRIFNRIVSRVCDSGTESQKLVVSNRSRRDVEDIAKIAHLLECLGECKD